ncbi:hypothetical protein D3C81_1436510 [compost metagenome]
MVVGLHGFDLAEGFRHIAADIGDAVLAQSRQIAYASAENQDRRDHERQGNHHDAGEFCVGHEQQDDTANHHQQVAQEHRQRRADHRLQQRRVSGQSRLDLGTAVVLVKARMEIDQMVEHLAADVGHAALADPRHPVEPGKRTDRQTQHHQHEDADALVELMRRLSHEAPVDQQLDPLPHRQRDGGRNDQRQQRSDDLPAVRGQKSTGQTQRATVS